jgi:hypothetical protein
VAGVACASADGADSATMAQRNKSDAAAFNGTPWVITLDHSASAALNQIQRRVRNAPWAL